MAAVLLGVGAVGPTLAQGRSARARAPSGGARRVLARASIVGGAEASIAEFPFQVALYDPRAGSPAKGFFCGGVILGATRVATAAHCLIGERGRHSPPAEIEVLAGSSNLEPVDPGSVRDSVVAATVDPAYSTATGDYDVGVLRLARPLWSGSTPTLDGRATIAPLAPDAARALRSTAALASGSASAPVQVTISGWGDLNPEPGGTPSYPRRLRKARVPLVPMGLCEAAYDTIEQAITPRMMCAGGARLGGSSGVDSCYGDSGGPLVIGGGGATPAGDVLLGLVDFGNGCAQAGYPGVYVRVADPAVANFLDAGSARASVAPIRRGVCHAALRRHGAHGSRGLSRRRRRCKA
ncbi:MAG: serine protease [Solirubrobacterales bacterium]